eukprot:TRINITY_DN6322_c0_g1_i1.p1 TRINITY_DN6322_c0_g1~~TRINITY_DN6322_c0_g1_i1.p1  ORF type:complete len:136 (+),score=29.19 TRINITY_DN6322_c0_g1_i1:41-448(+)
MVDLYKKYADLKDEYSSKPAIQPTEDNLKNPSKTGLLNLLGDDGKTWTKYWCVLHDTHLYTFTEENKYNTFKSSFDMSEFCTIEKSLDTDVGKENCFSVAASKRVLIFSASDDAEKDTWVTKLGRAVIKARSKSS